MAEAIVSIVLEGLSNAIIQELKSLKSVGGKVQSARTQLQFMRAYLKDADARQGRDEAIRIWVACVRDAAYDLEDVIGTYLLKVAFKRKPYVLTRFTGIFIKGVKGVNLHRIGSDIEKITAEISQLSSTMLSFNLHQTRESGGDTFLQRQQERRISYPHIVEPHVVGLARETEILAKRLIKEKGDRVVAIWGMPGLGKTTLAKRVYHHGEVKRHFDCFAWVCISQQCQGREVLKEILTKLISPTNEERKEIADLGKDQIAERLWNTQKEKKCLVVLDDIWNSDAWSSLQAGFPMNEETGSRILLTTRNKEVPSYADKNGFLFEPRSLNDDESWELFEKIAMSGTENTNSNIYEQKKELGMKMLQHCQGLPLAITVLAGLLARKDTVEEWNTVHENVYEYIRRGTDLGTDYKGEGFEGVLWLLELSYDNLPYYLKLCFLYLAHFPEDYEISVSTLTKLWMAEGFISSARAEVMEDVSYRCLNELVGRCMVQVGQHGCWGKKIKTCHLHDLMRDLCMLKAKQGNFVHIINYYGAVEIKQTPNDRVRRVAIYLGLSDEVDTYGQGKDKNYGHVRSVLYFCPGNVSFGNSQILRHKNFTLLRVLKFEGIKHEYKLLDEIGNLVHLRFLSVKDSLISAVPSSIANLVCLQTLDLRSSSGSLEIANRNVFSMMENLRHLYLPKNYFPKDLLLPTEAVNLHTVVNIKASDLDDFVKQTNLRKLRICIPDVGLWEKKEEGRNIIFKHLQSLVIEVGWGRPGQRSIPLKMVLSCPNIYKMELNGEIRELPEDLLCLTNLTQLKLETFGNIKDDHIKVLEKLPSLRKLFFNRGNFSGPLVCSEGGFPFLECLYLCSLMELTEWKVEKGAMPSLCRLQIVHCSDLKRVPDGIQHITTLKELIIFMMPCEFCSRLGEGGEDFYKIQHVQSCLISSPCR